MAVVQSTPHPSSLCLSIDKPQYSSAEPLDTCQLAKLIYSGTTNFHRQFTQILGVTPNEYITTIWLNAACKLLEETDQLVADIATAVGFYDQSHFTKAFKKARGLPAEPTADSIVRGGHLMSHPHKHKGSSRDATIDTVRSIDCSFQVRHYNATLAMMWFTNTPTVVPVNA